MQPENTFVGLGFDADSTAKAIAAAEQYGEIFVS